MKYFNITTIVLFTTLLSYDALLSMDNLSAQQEQQQKIDEDNRMSDLLLHMRELEKKYQQLNQQLNQSSEKSNKKVAKKRRLHQSDKSETAKKLQEKPLQEQEVLPTAFLKELDTIDLNDPEASNKIDKIMNNYFEDDIAHQ